MAWPSVTVSEGTFGSVGDSTREWSHTCTANDTKLVVLVGTGVTNASSVVTGVTYNGQSLTQISGANIYEGTFERAQIFELNDPPTGTAYTIVVSKGVSAQLVGYAISFDGAQATTGAASTNTGTSTNPTVTVADSASGDIVVSLLSSDNGVTTTQAGSLIGEDEGVEGGDSSFNAQYQTASGANTVCSWTNAGSGSGWAAVGVAIKSAGASQSNAPRAMHHYRQRS